MRTVTVNVTQEDINKAFGNPSLRGDFCPVERAIARDAGLRTMVAASGWQLVADFLGGESVTSFPNEVADWIRTFDNTHPPLGEPFSFELEIPDDVS